MPENELPSLCECAPCVSLRRELVTIFGVPKVREGQSWNEAMLGQITYTLIDRERKGNP